MKTIILVIFSLFMCGKLNFWKLYIWLKLPVFSHDPNKELIQTFEGSSWDLKWQDNIQNDLCDSSAGFFKFPLFPLTTRKSVVFQCPSASIAVQCISVVRFTVVNNKKTEGFQFTDALFNPSELLCWFLMMLYFRTVCFFFFVQIKRFWKPLFTRWCHICHW